MKIGIPTEIAPGERRVAATPATVVRLVDLGYDVAVQAGLGSGAGFEDAQYAAAGATVEPAAVDVLGTSDVVLKVEPPRMRDDGSHEADDLREGALLICFVFPKRCPELLAQLAAGRVSTLAMDAVPRITRAQKLDALSSMANLAGYRAVVEAANHYQSFMSGQFTAAGRVDPAKVLVIGAGVAGLAAIGAARGLGAIVRAFDTREAVRDEVRSLGGEFLELDYEEDGEGQGGYAKVMSPAFIAAEMALFLEQAPEVDIVITTALVPGTKAPVLWNRETVEAMKPGSVIVDLAAAQGGNCELTVAGEVVDHGGVKIVGATDLTSRMAPTASQLYGMNLVRMIEELGDASSFKLDLEDEVIRTSLVTHGGEITWPPPALPQPSPKPAVAKPAPKPVAPPAAPVASPAAAGKALSGWLFAIIGLALAGLWAYLKITADPAAQAHADTTREFVQHLTVFVLACFVGWQVVWNVTAALHTPLMSVTNAISGIIIVGGILEGGRAASLDVSVILGVAATFLATLNIAGGFLVTHRMLRMFRKG